MQCGEMKHKVNIVRVNESSGPFGDNEEIVFQGIWAKKEELFGTQLYQSMGESDKIPCNFIVRRNDNITNKMFVVCDGKKYDIKSAIPLAGNDEYIILSCYEVI